jgi:peptide deformylase
MTVLDIVKGENNPVLRSMCKEVTDFDSELKKTIRDMKETLKKAKGLGIAAPQVGLDIRAFIFITDYGTKKQVVREAINPEVIFASEDQTIGEEGCLSLPGKFGNVYRPNEIIVSFFDLSGDKQQMRLLDLDARVFLHELDHINGVLFLDRLADSLIL